MTSASAHSINADISALSSVFADISAACWSSSIATRSSKHPRLGAGAGAGAGAGDGIPTTAFVLVRDRPILYMMSLYVLIYCSPTPNEPVDLRIESVRLDRELDGSAVPESDRERSSMLAPSNARQERSSQDVADFKRRFGTVCRTQRHQERPARIIHRRSDDTRGRERTLPSRNVSARTRLRVLSVRVSLPRCQKNIRSWLRTLGKRCAWERP